jgi:hypothetical protein
MIDKRALATAAAIDIDIAGLIQRHKMVFD